MPTYTLNGVNYTYIVGNPNASVAVSSSASGAKTIESSFVVDGATYNVTSIATNAFSICTGLTSIIIPDTVTSIGNTAFQNCINMTSITISNALITIGNQVFRGCGNLTSITIPNTVTTIGFGVFNNCSKITTFTIPSSVTSIGTAAFAGCTLLTTCNLGAIPNIGASLFQDCTNLTNIIIPTSVTSIGASSFQGCSKLTDITIPTSVTSIGASSFLNCTTLTNIIIPTSVTSIGDSSFQGCYRITTISIPSSVISIGNNAFTDCTLLNSCGLGSATNLGTSLFQGCINLTSITIPNTVTSIGVASFYGCLVLTSVTIPSSVTSIGNSVFYGCSGLTSVTIPSSVTSIGTNVFYNCTSLTSVTIPSSVTTIGTNALFNCISLTSLTIPSSVTTIGTNALFNCTSLTNIIVDANNPNFSSENGVLFNKSKTILILYPSASINTSYIIPNSVSTINTNSFLQCINLTSVTIPSSILSINSSVFTNCNNLVTVTFMGVIPTISPSGNFTASGDTALYRSDINIDQTFALSKLTMFSNSNTWISQVPTPTITGFSVPTKTFGDTAFTLTLPTSNSTGAFVYISSNTAVATIAGSTVTIVGGGSSTISAVQVDSETYSSGIITATLQVNQITAVISSFSVVTKTFGNAAFAITNPPSNSTGAFTYTSSNTEVATIVGNTITIVGAGTSTITATQASTANYTSATKTAIFTVNKATPTLVTFYRPTSPLCGDPPSTLLAVTPSTGDFTYTSSNTGVATIAGNVITIVGTGSTTITINQASTANYNSFTTTTSITVAQGTPRISFSIPTRNFASINRNFTIPLPTSNSTGAFTYTSSDTTVATVTGNAISVKKPGSTTITANQASTTNFLSGTVQTILTITKAPPTLDPFYISSKTFGSFTTYTFPSYYCDSDGVINYTSSNFAIVSSSGTYGNMLRAFSAGVVVIRGTITETATYKSAIFDTTFAVHTSTWTLTPTITNFVVPSKSVGDAPFTLTDPTSNSPGTFVYASSNPLIASIVGNVVTIVSGGNCTIFATQVSTADYRSATITATIQVGTSTPILSNFSIPGKTNGDAAFTITAPTTNSTGEFTYTSSDTNVAFINGSTIRIIGVGTSTITATQAATDNYTSATITATFQVGLPAPTIGTFTVPAKTVGNAAFTITAPTTNSTGAFTYTSSDTSVATIAGTTITIVGTGSSIITATQASTATYGVGTKTATLTVSQATPTIGALTISAKTLGDAPFQIINPTSNSTGAFTYTSSNTAVATVDGSTITIVAAGTSTITATQASTTNYVSGTKTATLTVNKTTTVLTSFSVPAKKVGDAAFTITDPISNSTGAFTYTSSNTAVATVAGTTITVVGVGTSTITATQATTANYTSATTTATLQVDAVKETTVLTNFSVPTKTFGDTPFQITAPTTNSNGAFTYTSSNTEVATVAGTTITIIGAGSSTITASQASTANYTSATTTATLTVSQSTPTITNFSVPTKVFGDAPFQITAPTTNSNGLITYTSSNTAVATVAGTTITIVGAGTSTITASQASTPNYTSAAITATFQVKQVPTLTNFTISTKKVGNAPFAITAPTSNSTGAFTYTSSNTAVATVDGSTITIIGVVGTSTITATQASTADFGSGTITATLTVGQGTLVLTNFSVPPKSIEDAAFTITSPTTNSTGLITYTSSNASVATIAGSTITIVGIGSTTITASQASTTNYTSATISTIFQVSNILPTLSNFSIPARTVGSAALTMTPPTSNSDGAWTYTSSNTAVAIVVGNKINAVGPGTSTITAVQASTADFGSGTITATFQVSLITTVIDNFSIPTKTMGNVPFRIQASTNNSGTTITYTSSDLSVATIVGDIVTIVGAGTSTITASQVSTSNYASASTTATLTVNQLTTVLTNFSVAAKKVGDADFTLNAPLTNRSGAFIYTSSNTAVATIAGNVVSIVGAGSSTITATQEGTANYTSESMTGTLTVSQSVSTITNFSVPAKVFGDASFSITAPTTNSTGALTYTSSNTFVATIAGNVITIVGAGTSTITATQATTPNYISGMASSSLVVSKRSPTITNFSIPEKTFGDAAFSITNPTTNSDSLITYTSSNTAVATISGKTITIVGVGTSTITASQTTTSNFMSGSITATLTVNERTPGLTNFVVPVKIIEDAAFTITPPTTKSNGALTYTSSNTAVATIVGDLITIVGAGTSTITASQASTANFASGTITATLQVNMKPTVLTNFSIPAKTFGNAPLTISPPTTNRAGAFTYTSSNTAVATIVENTITIVGAGTSTITASQEATANYASATITDTLQVSPAATLLSNFSFPIKTPGDAPFTITPPTTNNNGGFTYTSSNPAVATIDGDVITIVGFGTSTIIAVQASTANYTTRTISTFLRVNQIITELTNFSVPAKVFGDAAFSITPPTSNSDNNFIYTSSNTFVATVAENVITIVGAGTTTITAFKDKTLNSTAGIISTPLVVSKCSPTITNFSVPEKTFGDAAFSITNPTTDSDSLISYTSSNTAVATISGKTITIIGVGTSTITASQTTTSNFISGSITATLTVNKATPTITNFAVPTKTVGDAAFAITAPTTNGNGALTYTSSNTAVATIVGSMITIVGAGTSTITANQASTSKYTSATTTATLEVNLKTTLLTAFVVPVKTFGNPAFAITAPTSNRVGTFTYTSSNTEVATIVGNMITIVGGGSSIITAVQASTSIFASGTITATFQVNPITTVLTKFVIPAKTFGTEAFTIPPPTSNSNGEITYISSIRSVANISGNEITITGGGSSTITAVQASTPNYTSATIPAVFVVNRAALTLTNFSIPPREIGSGEFMITPPTTASIGNITYTSSNKNVAIASGNMISIKAFGTTTITASQAMSANYVAGTITTPFVVNKKTPIINYFILPEKTFGDDPLTITPPTSSNTGSTFTYTSSNTNVARIVKNIITIIGAGTTTITATQAMSTTFGPGTIDTTFQVNKATTLLSEFCVFNRIVGDAPFTITPPTSTSVGAFTYTSSNTNVATIAGDVITVVGGGESIITAVQETTSNYTAATITAVFQVKLPPPPVGDLEISNKSLDTPVFTIVDPTKPANNTGTWTYTSSDTTKATINGNVVTLLATGIIIISGVLSSDSLYSSASVMTQFSINPRFNPASSYVFIKSTVVAAAVPANIYPILNVVYLPLTMSTTENNIKFNNPNIKIGTIFEKQANRNLIINTLLNMFSPISVISIPTALLYMSATINKTKTPTTKIIRPYVSTEQSPLVINSIATDITVAFLCLLANNGNSVQINGNVKTAGSFIKITRENNKYKIQRTDKMKKTVINYAVNGDTLLFAGIRIVVSSL